MDNRQFDYYQRLKLKIKKYGEQESAKNNRWFDFIMLTPDFFKLLCTLAVENRIPVKKRLKLASAIAYFMSPFDFLPEEIIGPAGYLDDVTVAALILKELLDKGVDVQLLREHWGNERDIREAIENILEHAEEMLGKSLWEKIKEKFGDKDEQG